MLDNSSKLSPKENDLNELPSSIFKEISTHYFQGEKGKEKYLFAGCWIHQKTAKIYRK